jgi:TetR/AcrR family transcriptional regulator, repressor for uid operon
MPALWHTAAMPSMEKRKPGRPPAAKADETRKRILKAARAVFSERGYDGATFQKIAERADLTRPAINHYFSSKRALYCEVTDDSMELFINTSSVEQSKRETTLAGRLTVFIKFAMQSNLPYPSASAFMITTLLESKRHPELSGTANDALRLRRAFLTSAVEEAIERGELLSDTDVNSVVETLLAVLCGIAFYAGYLRTPDEMEAITDQVRLLLSGELLRPDSQSPSDPDQRR